MYNILLMYNIDLLSLHGCVKCSIFPAIWMSLNIHPIQWQTQVHDSLFEIKTKGLKRPSDRFVNKTTYQFYLENIYII